jgi:pimeloyl-ACP methyl ester carboxylesterase
MSNLVVEDMTVPSEPGIDIFVRNKRPADLAAFTPERTVLFVHGSTYPAHTGFDIPLGGQSWMESIASRGYDVYCLDIRGYGRSTRPKAMAEPAQNNPPVVRAPNGTVQDTQDYWSSGKTMYDPGKITVPDLIVIGEWDRDTPPYMAQAIFPLLINSPGRRLVMLPEATHHMMLEKNRLMLFRTVQAFLDEASE